MPKKVSLLLEDAVEGGAIPWNRNLVWKEVRFDRFTYPNSTVVTTALRVTFVDDEGVEYVQHYSVGNPEKYIPVNDGRSLESEEGGIPKGSNAYVLLQALINVGVPATQLGGGDISVLDGLKTFNIAQPEPKREGLTRDPNARPKNLSVPSQLLSAPWDKKGVRGKTAPKSSDGATAVVEFAKEVIGSGESMSRQDLAASAFKQIKDKARQATVTGNLFKPEASAALVAAGFGVDGDEITAPAA